MKENVSNQGRRVSKGKKEERKKDENKEERKIYKLTCKFKA